MASKWPGVGVSVRRGPLQEREQLAEKEAEQAAGGHPEPSSGALGSLCRHFQRRLPLRAVSRNLGAGPSWKRLENPEAAAQQGLQAAARSAKNALGSVSQRIQESCQSSTKWLVGTQVKARKRRRGAQTGSRPLAHTPGQKSPRLCGAAPASSALGPRERPCHRLSGHVGPRAHPQWRSQREPTFRSPYSSTEPLCSPSESDSDPEPVGAGLQHLQKLSRQLDEAIVAEERVPPTGDTSPSRPPVSSGDMTMTVSLIRD
ncbi:protein PIMREG isoform X1 [Leopardus geoffroyi]|uniref:protein PIMREG isoform X1 n=1 Tax=Leopardus geoffroyi TaxID=46844 RepID=UPI001E262016|nr:protein PIMREG isoform X1 [Leopardus geoffroyi]XP_045343263.1 protein PIMREG isoform X1 [Leopardus geoffroyi]